MLDTQTDTADSIRAWAAHLATITGQLQSQDPAVAGVLNKGPAAADEVRALFDRLQPTLPIVLANLVSLGEVAVTYQPSLEQLLVLLPQGTAVTQAAGVANRNTKQDYKGAYLVFNLNLQPAARRALTGLSCRPAAAGAHRSRTTPTGRRATCTAGSRRTRPFNVRGARNLPVRDGARQTRTDREDVREQRELRAAQRRLQLEGRPQRHAVRSAGSAAAARRATCASELQRPGPAPPPIAAAEYDPATGTYVGPDGHVYTQANLARGATEEQTWQTMLLPPKGN